MGRFLSFRSLAASFVIVSLSFAQQASVACTSMVFDVDSDVYFAKTYDWQKEHGYLTLNKRGMIKSSLEAKASDRSFSWTSIYGSLTFNQYGHELPNSGINEKGLTVEVMVLEKSTFPEVSNLPSINESQWVQYILDTSATLEDAKANASKVRISKILIPLHYVICDATNECAAFESLEGKQVIIEKSDFEPRVLANSTYQQSSTYLRGHLGFGGTRPIPTGSQTSLNRFLYASDQLRSWDGSGDPVDFGFSGLSRVTNKSTQWKTVYNLTNQIVTYSTKTRPSRKVIDLQDASIDWSCGTGAKTLPIINQLAGTITEKFVPYSDAENEALVRKSLGLSVPPALVQKAIALPKQMKCQDRL